MAVYEVRLTRTAAKEMSDLDPAIAQRVEEAIDLLATAPRSHRAQKLTASRDTYRVRVGDYRILYQVDDKARVVKVIRVGHLSQIYRHR